MNGAFLFNFKYIEKEFEKLIEQGYTFITCKDYIEVKKSNFKKIIVNRIDVDFSVKKTAKILDILKNLNIKSTFFIRLHAAEYNPFSFENYRILKRIVDEGHELGYHSEVIDQATIWNEDPDKCFLRDIEVLSRIFSTKIYGSASHGGLTGLNNLDFWKNRKPSDFGLLYEAYDNNKEFNLFYESLYISDSEWTRWKSYTNGILNVDDRRSPSEHALNEPNLIYLLIHPDTYFNNHIYE